MQMREQIIGLAALWKVDLVLVEDTSSGMGLIQWTGTWKGPGSPITGNAQADLAKQLPEVMRYINDNGGVGPLNAAKSAKGP